MKRKKQFYGEKKGERRIPSFEVLKLGNRGTNFGIAGTIGITFRDIVSVYSEHMDL